MVVRRSVAPGKPWRLLEPGLHLVLSFVRRQPVDYAVHELLHDVAGELDDGSSHTTGGWLSHRVDDDGWARELSPATRRSLADDFAPGRSPTVCWE